MTVWFVGVDLAWSERNPSGVAILSGGAGRPLVYVRSETHVAIEEIAAQIRALDGPVWVAIDAPLVVRNETGQRPVDRSSRANTAASTRGRIPPASSN